MQRILKGSVLVLALALAAAPQLEAQRRGGYLARRGFWFGLGAGYGSLGASCSQCSTARDNSYSGNLRLGGTLSPRVRVGVETNGFYKTEAGDKLTAGQVGALINYYPSATGNLYVRASAGLNSFMLNFSGGNEATISGIGAGIGIGYDMFLGRSLSISPFFNYLTAFSGNLKVNGTDTGEKVKPNLWQVGAAVVFH